LRTYFLYLFCVVALAGCVNYAGMKGQSTPLDVSALSQQHHYPQYVSHLAQKAASSAWWQRFHDPDLNQYITLALADSPTMRIAESRVRKAQQLSDEAASTLWPSVDASGYVQRQRFSTFGLAPPPFNGRTFNIGDVGLNFNYEFDLWGKNRQFLAASVSEACATEADLAQARLVLSEAVAKTYFQLQRDVAQVKIAEATLQQRQALLVIIKDRAKHGIQSDLPVKSTLADVQAIKIKLYQTKQAEKLSRHQLAVLLGKNPLTTTLEARSFSYRQHRVALPSSLPANLLATRPDILAARLRTEAAAHRINVAKARFFPNINLSALFSFQGVGLNHLFYKTSQNNAITGAVDLPIFDAGARRANLGAKYADYDLAVNHYNETILSALREVADQLSTLKNVKAELAAQEASLQAIQRNYNLTRSRYNHGVVDYVPMIAIKESLLQQQATQLDLQTQHLQAVVTLIVALGGNELTGQG
jgi:NodT family efflux transporter outer membrane factor (OMF) lipoprotein